MQQEVTVCLEIYGPHGEIMWEMAFLCRFIFIIGLIVSKSFEIFGVCIVITNHRLRPVKVLTGHKADGCLWK